MTTQAQDADVSKPDAVPSKRGFPWKWLFYLGAVMAIVAIAKYFHVQDLLKQALDWVGKFGPWGPVIFIAIYIVATVLFIPGSVLTLGAGAIFGVGLGSVCVSIAATLGATSAFIVGRYFARDAIARKIEGNARFSAIDKAVAAQGWKIVFLTRLSPVFPFTLLNYAFSLTRVNDARNRHVRLSRVAGPHQRRPAPAHHR